MAKDRVQYFSHDSNAREDEKIIKLRMQHGWKGYGLYWAIIEKLRDSDGYKLKSDCNTIAFGLQVECKCIESVINDFDLFTINDEYFWSESLLRRMKLKEEKSQKMRKNAKKRWDNNRK